jgi:nucleotide-binding universal stress UspA family protein
VDVAVGDAVIEIRRILCPFDFSACAVRALRQAVRLGERYDATVVALHVIPTSLPAPGRLGALTNPALLDPHLHERTLADLRRFVAHAAGPKRAVEVEVRDGAPARLILQRAAELPADLLVLGSHGRGGFGKWVLGSVAQRVLRKARCPVLTVPAHGGLPRGPSLFGTVLWATDFSAPATAALGYALALAGEDRSPLLLVHVTAHEPEPGPPGAPSDPASELQQRAREWLCAAVPEEARDRSPVEAIVTAGKAHREIVRIATEKGAELIVMGAQGADALDRWVFGSTAEQVLHSAPCPVLTVRAG